MKNSVWDPATLKKYNSQSHNKLISQLASELKAYPIIRKQEEDSSVEDSKSKRVTTKSKEGMSVSDSNENVNHTGRTIYSNVHETTKIVITDDLN